jgi:hypothetical protein
VEQISSYARDTWNLFIQLLKTTSKRRKIRATNSRKKAKYKLERKELSSKFKEKV